MPPFDFRSPVCARVLWWCCVYGMLYFYGVLARILCAGGLLRFAIANQPERFMCWYSMIIATGYRSAQDVMFVHLNIAQVAYLLIDIIWLGLKALTVAHNDYILRDSRTHSHSEAYSAHTAYRKPGSPALLWHVRFSLTSCVWSELFAMFCCMLLSIELQLVSSRAWKATLSNIVDRDMK